MKTLYDFEVFTKKTVKKEIEKSRQKKDKETGEVKKWTEKVIEEVEEDVPVQILIKKPTRSLFEESSLFYSISFNKYVRMGLLTDSQVAKKQLDLGDGFSQEQLSNYLKHTNRKQELQEMIIRINIKENPSEEDQERLRKLKLDLVSNDYELEKYEKLKSSAYEHTADSKARSETLLWWCLFLSYIKKNDEDEAKPMFSGSTFEEKKLSMEQYEDEDDEVYNKSYQRISDVISIWYFLGQDDKGDIQKTIDQFDQINAAEKDE